MSPKKEQKPSAMDGDSKTVAHAQEELEHRTGDTIPAEPQTFRLPPTTREEPARAITGEAKKEATEEMLELYRFLGSLATQARTKAKGVFKTDSPEKVARVKEEYNELLRKNAAKVADLRRRSEDAELAKNAVRTQLLEVRQQRIVIPEDMRDPVGASKQKIADLDNTLKNKEAKIMDSLREKLNAAASLYGQRNKEIQEKYDADLAGIAGTAEERDAEKGRLDTARNESLEQEEASYKSNTEAIIAPSRENLSKWYEEEKTKILAGLEDDIGKLEKERKLNIRNAEEAKQAQIDEIERAANEAAATAGNAAEQLRQAEQERVYEKQIGLEYRLFGLTDSEQATLLTEYKKRLNKQYVDGDMKLEEYRERMKILELDTIRRRGIPVGKLVYKPQPRIKPPKKRHSIKV